jgi:hypothetical protein
LTSGPRGGSLIPERLTRVIICCLAPEDGQGSGSARQPRISRPLYGIRPKASKGLNRRRRVLQNPHSRVPRPPTPIATLPRHSLMGAHSRLCFGPVSPLSPDRPTNPQRVVVGLERDLPVKGRWELRRASYCAASGPLATERARAFNAPIADLKAQFAPSDDPRGLISSGAAGRMPALRAAFSQNAQGCARLCRAPEVEPAKHSCC